MQGFGLGENVSERDQTFTHVMTIEFDEERDLHAYLKSDRHEMFVANIFKPRIAQRVIATLRVCVRSHPAALGE